MSYEAIKSIALTEKEAEEKIEEASKAAVKNADRAQSDAKALIEEAKLKALNENKDKLASVRAAAEKEAEAFKAEEAKKLAAELDAARAKSADAEKMIFERILKG